MPKSAEKEKKQEKVDEQEVKVENTNNVKEEKTAFQMKREVKKLMKDLKQA